LEHRPVARPIILMIYRIGATVSRDPALKQYSHCTALFTKSVNNFQKFPGKFFTGVALKRIGCGQAECSGCHALRECGSSLTSAATLALACTDLYSRIPRTRSHMLIGWTAHIVICASFLRDQRSIFQISPVNTSEFLPLQLILCDIHDDRFPLLLSTRPH